MAKYTVKAFGKRGNQYGPTEAQSSDEADGMAIRFIHDLRNPCFEKKITVEIEEIA